jgi:hypothetical protein
MKWHRKTDYHGSRSYEQDRPAVSQPSLVLARFTNILKEKWRRFAMRPMSSTVLLHEGEHSFSLLGATSRRRSHRKDAECPFPTAHPSRLRHEN